MRRPKPFAPTPWRAVAVSLAAAVWAASTVPAAAAAAGGPPLPKLFPVPPKVQALSGYWETSPTPGERGANRYGSDPQLAPAAKAHLDQQVADRKNGLLKDNLAARCNPPGMPSILAYFGVHQISGDAQKITWIIEMFGSIRWIWLDGRKHPEGDNLTPTFNGHSIGHWEGDTLVVDTVGISTKSEIYAGLSQGESFPHGENLRIVERIHLADGGQTLIDDYVVTDPQALLAPWKATMRYRRTGWETTEWACENNRAE